MINRVILTGRITADIELRRTTDGTPYTFFTIAVNRRSSGNDQTDFISCVAWRQTAELMDNYLKKGALIGLEGRLEVYSKQEDGKYENRTNVQVSNITFLESKSQAEKYNSENYNDKSSDSQEETMTFSKEASFDQSETTPISENTENSAKSEEINANNINLEEIKF